MARDVRQRGASAQRGALLVLALAALLPLAAHVLLYRSDVPLGKPGTLVYPYSPLVAQRLVVVLPAAVLGLVAGTGVILAETVGRARRWGGLISVTAALIGLAGWLFFAPPAHLSQHYFNLHSPSHDGAFFVESFQVTDLRDYLAQFPQRARTPPAHMRGARVISNPPGTTLLAVAAREAVHRSPALRRAVEMSIGSADTGSAENRARVIESSAFAWSLLALWLLATPFYYGVARLFVPVGSAAAFAICCVVSPMTFVFSPGKDPAQLLTAAVPLYFWLLAWRRTWRWAAVAAGGMFVLACAVSLVHVWVALIVGLATFIASCRVRNGLRSAVFHLLVPATLGAILVAALFYVVGSFNLLAGAWAAARSQAEITRGAEAMPPRWQLLGVPLFLLFAGPAVWCSAAAAWFASDREAVDARRQDAVRSADTAGDQPRAVATLGTWLLLASGAVMLLTIGFTNMEAPRLWIPFVPLLLLGSWLKTAWGRGRAARRGPLLAAVVFAQVASAALHWSLMDMRETETRLRADSPRFFD